MRWAALRLLNEMIPAEQQHGGLHEQGSNVTLPRGNRANYTLARLKRDAPKLAERVIAGELSAHAAAIEAGFRQRKIQVAPTVDEFERAIRKHLSDEDQAILVNKLARPN